MGYPPTYGLSPNLWVNPQPISYPPPTYGLPPQPMGYPPPPPPIRPMPMEAVASSGFKCMSDVSFTRVLYGVCYHVNIIMLIIMLIMVR